MPLLGKLYSSPFCRLLTCSCADTESSECQAVLQGHTSLVGQLQMRGGTLVTGGSDGSVRVWSLEKMCPIHRLAAHDNSVTSLQFDDTRIVSGGSDGRVKVWDLKTGQLVRELISQGEAVWRVAFEAEKCVAMALRNSRTVMEVRNPSIPAQSVVWLLMSMIIGLVLLPARRFFPRATRTTTIYPYAATDDRSACSRETVKCDGRQPDRKRRAGRGYARCWPCHGSSTAKSVVLSGIPGSLKRKRLVIHRGFGAQWSIGFSRGEATREPVVMAFLDHQKFLYSHNTPQHNPSPSLIYPTIQFSALVGESRVNQRPAEGPPGDVKERPGTADDISNQWIWFFVGSIAMALTHTHTHLRFSKQTHNARTHAFGYGNGFSIYPCFIFSFLTHLACFISLLETQREDKPDIRSGESGANRQTEKTTIHEQHWIWEQYKYTLFRNKHSECITHHDTSPLPHRNCDRTIKTLERRTTYMQYRLVDDGLYYFTSALSSDCYHHACMPYIKSEPPVRQLCPLQKDRILYPLTTSLNIPEH